MGISDWEAGTSLGKREQEVGMYKSKVNDTGSCSLVPCIVPLSDLVGCYPHLLEVSPNGFQVARHVRTKEVKR